MTGWRKLAVVGGMWAAIARKRRGVELVAGRQQRARKGGGTLLRVRNCGHKV